jgi:hypothetical protein
MCIYNSFVNVRFIIIITQFKVAIATNYLTLTPYLNVIYEICDKRANSLLFQFIMSIL